MRRLGCASVERSERLIPSTRHGKHAVDAGDCKYTADVGVWALNRHSAASRPQPLQRAHQNAERGGVDEGGLTEIEDQAGSAPVDGTIDVPAQLGSRHQVGLARELDNDDIGVELAIGYAVGHGRATAYGQALPPPSGLDECSRAIHPIRMKPRRSSGFMLFGSCDPQRLRVRLCAFSANGRP